VAPADIRQICTGFEKLSQNNIKKRFTMPQLAIKGIYKDGKIIPTEDIDIPFHEPMNVIIVFTSPENDESRYYRNDWQLAEKQATEDYQRGSIRSAESIDEMFKKIAMDSDGN
jgi:hypothetical protein